MFATHVQVTGYISQAVLGEKLCLSRPSFPKDMMPGRSADVWSGRSAGELRGRAVAAESWVVVAKLTGTVSQVLGVGKANRVEDQPCWQGLSSSRALGRNRSRAS